jgi:hypothetical protein
MTPVVVIAAMPAARAVLRFIRLGRRCFPVAQVNAMKLSGPFLPSRLPG